MCVCLFDIIWKLCNNNYTISKTVAIPTNRPTDIHFYTHEQKKKEKKLKHGFFDAGAIWEQYFRCGLPCRCWMTFKMYNVSILAYIRARLFSEGTLWIGSLSKQNDILPTSACPEQFVWVCVCAGSYRTFWLMLQLIYFSVTEKKHSAYFTCCCRYSRTNTHTHTHCSSSGCHMIAHIFFCHCCGCFWLDAFRWRIFMLCYLLPFIKQHRTRNVCVRIFECFSFMIRHTNMHYL